MMTVSLSPFSLTLAPLAAVQFGVAAPEYRLLRNQERKALKQAGVERKARVRLEQERRAKEIADAAATQKAAYDLQTAQRRAAAKAAGRTSTPKKVEPKLADWERPIYETVQRLNGQTKRAVQKLILMVRPEIERPPAAGKALKPASEQDFFRGLTAILPEFATDKPIQPDDNFFAAFNMGRYLTQKAEPKTSAGTLLDGYRRLVTRLEKA